MNYWLKKELITPKYTSDGREIYFMHELINDEIFKPTSSSIDAVSENRTKHTPIMPGSMYGEVYDGRNGLLIQTFISTENNSLEISDKDYEFKPLFKVMKGWVDPINGIIKLIWNGDVPKHVLVKISYEIPRRGDLE